MFKYISFLLLLCFNQLNAQNSFHIKGLFEGYEGVIYLDYDDIADSAIVNNGQFEFRGTVDLPTPAHIMINDVKQVYLMNLFWSQVN